MKGSIDVVESSRAPGDYSTSAIPAKQISARGGDGTHRRAVVFCAEFKLKSLSVERQSQDVPGRDAAVEHRCTRRAAHARAARFVWKRRRGNVSDKKNARKLIGAQARIQVKGLTVYVADARAESPKVQHRGACVIPELHACSRCYSYVLCAA